MPGHRERLHHAPLHIFLEKERGTPRHFFAFFLLLALAAALYGDILISPGERVLSRAGTDIWRIFIYWRDLGFAEIRKGNLPLWNPYIFSGIPFLGAMQSALLYPPNFLHLLLPVAAAINAGIALHVFLTGFFVYLWASFRRLHYQACLLSAVLAMFSGSVMMSVYAGHLTDLATMTWMPLLFLALDGLTERPTLGMGLLGAFAVTMQILAGHPQYLYYTGIAAVIYTALGLKRAGRSLLSAAAFAGIYAGAVALGAVQLLPGLEAAGESVRSAGVSYSFASSFFFPLENLLTLISPFFYGDMSSVPYWGRSYMWETTFFIGVTGLALALYGALYGEKTTRKGAAAMVLILTVLALGAQTPLFSILYHFLPGFNKFRGASKFIFPATFFMALLAGIGMDALIKGRGSCRKAAAVSGGVGLAVGGAAFLLYGAAQGTDTAAWWRLLMEFMRASGSYLPAGLFDDRAFLSQAASFSGLSLILSSAACLVLAVLLAARSYSSRSLHLIALLAFLEVFAFAGLLRVDFDRRDLHSPELEKFLRDHPGDYRVLNLRQPNGAFYAGVKEIWGYDPGVNLRYARFMAFTQGNREKEITNYLGFTGYHKFFSLLRLRYVVSGDEKKITLEEHRDAMPRVKLMHRFRVLPPGEILKEMEKDGFDPRQTVILERAPAVQPGPSPSGGSAAVTGAGTDFLTIEAHCPAPSLLLITDAYSRGWRGRPLPGSSQERYEIMPADYTLMAVPLQAGDHRFTVEYAPLGFRIGRWISLFAWSAWLILLVLAVKRGKIAREVLLET